MGDFICFLAQKIGRFSMYIERIRFLVSNGYVVLKLGLYIAYFMRNKVFPTSVRKQMLISPKIKKSDIVLFIMSFINLTIALFAFTIIVSSVFHRLQKPWDLGCLDLTAKLLERMPSPCFCLCFDAMFEKVCK